MARYLGWNSVLCDYFGKGLREVKKTEDNGQRSVEVGVDVRLDCPDDSGTGYSKVAE